MEKLTPPDLVEHTLYGVQGTKGVKFSPGSVPTLHEMQVLQFFPSDVGVRSYPATKEAAAPAGVVQRNGEAATVQKKLGRAALFLSRRLPERIV